MTTEKKPQTMSDLIGPHLPYLRRYARALTGAQDTGDRYAAVTLEAILAEPTVLQSARIGPRAALFRVFHAIWVSTDQPVAEAESVLHARAQKNMANLSPLSREALLLNTVEGFSFADVGEIMDLTESEAETLVERARAEMQGAIKGRVMIIEDEAIIATDLESIVESMGHDVAGIADTRDKATAMGRELRPDLILADIQLADNSSGIDAVKDLMQDMPDVPVIFITAFPERLLTGERPEPTFLIAKPYRPAQVISAVSQAMFFASTATLVA